MIVLVFSSPCCVAQRYVELMIEFSLASENYGLKCFS